ncbi:TetR/AcrR family transcriptional regulator [Nocardiopsis coralliicola]
MPKISAPTIAAHRAQTRERILGAIAELSRTQGIDEISMTDVAHAAGITRTALYNYFPDKAALLVAFAEQGTDDFLERYRTEVLAESGAAQRLDSFIRFQLEAMADHPHPAAAELGASLGPDAYRRLSDHVEPLQRLLVEILRGGVEAGEFDDVPPEATARLVLAMAGAQRVPLLQGETTLAEAHTLLAAFTLKALGTRTPPAAGPQGA